MPFGGEFDYFMCHYLRRKLSEDLHFTGKQLYFSALVPFYYMCRGIRGCMVGVTDRVNVKHLSCSTIVPQQLCFQLLRSTMPERRKPVSFLISYIQFTCQFDSVIL